MSITGLLVINTTSENCDVKRRYSLSEKSHTKHKFRI